MLKVYADDMELDRHTREERVFIDATPVIKSDVKSL